MKPVQCEFKTLLFLFLMSLTLVACGNTKKKDKENNVSENKTDQNEIYRYTYTFKMKQPGNRELTPAGSSTMYLSQKAVRSKTSMNIMGQNTEMDMLVKADKPNKVIMLNGKSKTYSIINPEELAVGGEMAEKMKKMYNDSVIVLGDEKMNGYDCTHLKIVTTLNVPGSVKKMGGQDSSVEEYWVSKGVPGHALFGVYAKSHPKILRGKSSEIYKYGVPVKMVSKESDAVNMVMELKTAKKQNVDMDLFEIPSGYTKKE